MGKRPVKGVNQFLYIPPNEADHYKRINSKGRQPKGALNFSKDKYLVGTPEQIEESFELAMEYTYKILEYAKKDDITQEEAEFLRRYFYFLGKGPRRNYFKMYGVTKLTYPDVLYILVSDISANALAPRFGIQPDLIRSLRRGDEPAWYPEFCLVKQLKRILYQKLKRVVYNEQHLNIPCLFERLPDGSEKMIFLTTSLKRAREMRKDYLGFAKWNALTKNKTLEDQYPVKYAPVYR